tara:strand:+ start:1066 stop:1227 length:162 start_codon:yes stop_codon:yes gene_type:complete
MADLPFGCLVALGADQYWHLVQPAGDLSSRRNGYQDRVLPVASVEGVWASGSE